jgi:hypothetical protein
MLAPNGSHRPVVAPSLTWAAVVGAFRVASHIKAPP